MKNEKRSIADRFLKIFSEVRPGESITVLILLLDFLLLLLGYSIIKIVREPLVLVSAEQDLQVLLRSDLPNWLVNVLKVQKGPQLKAAAYAFQALLFLAFIPCYSWFASKVKRLPFLIGVTGFFISNILLFYLASFVNIPFLGFAFYIWVGIFNMSMIAQFWSFANDIYSKSEGDRLFPIIAIGATAGAPMGSLIAKWLQNWPPFQTILLSAGILVIYLGLSLVVHFRESDTPKLDQATSPSKVEPLKKGSGFSLIFRNPYIILIAFIIMLLNLVNTSGEFILTNVVYGAAQAVSPENMGAYVQSFYGDFVFWVNIIAFLLQAFLASRIVKYTGIKGVVLMLPLISLGVYGLIGMGAGFTAIRWFKTAENSTDYSIMNTGKAMMWLPTTREEKYKAKQAVDTFFVRFGDLVAAIIFIVGTTVLHFGVRQLSGINLIFIAAWLILTFFFLRYHAKLVSR